MDVNIWGGNRAVHFILGTRCPMPRGAGAHTRYVGSSFSHALRHPGYLAGARNGALRLAINLIFLDAAAGRSAFISRRPLHFPATLRHPRAQIQYIEEWFIVNRKKAALCPLLLLAGQPSMSPPPAFGARGRRSGMREVWMLRFA